MAETTVALFQSIAVDQIRPAAHQARKTFDESSIKALAESMKQEGLLQPITVRIVTSDKWTVIGNTQDPSNNSSPITDHGSPITGCYELVSGERRLRAAKLLGWSAIDAKIVQTVSEAEAAAKGLVENLQREDLNPIEEARA
jgi:ParB family transcriptional regulator, chromosome partitioning protein